MEVGAVKQAFNNEVILLKKKVNQAKVQIIHKLTRKAKTLTEKKAPEHLKEKLKKKAESAVKEVLILKKIKARDVAKFMITHTGEVKDYLNKSNVDNNKACARLVLNKALQDKYHFFRNRFGNVPIKDLFMSRQERRKLKKEAREEKKNKKGKGKVVNSEGDWDVDDIDDKMNIDNNDSMNIDDDVDSNRGSIDESGSDRGIAESDDELETENQVKTKIINHSKSDEDDVEGEEDEEDDDDVKKDEEDDDAEEEEEDDDEKEEKTEDDEQEAEEEDDNEKTVGKFVKLKPQKENFLKKPTPHLVKSIENVALPIKEITKPKPKINKDKKVKENKNKNLNEKLQNRKFKKDSDIHTEGHKVVDPFFKTESGENYLSLAEPRQPDEIKEIHQQGNRKERRAAMFGHYVPKPRKYDGQNNFHKDNNGNFNDNNDRFGNKNNRFNNKNDRFNTKNDRFNSNNNFNKNSKFINGEGNFDNSRPKFNDSHSNNDKNTRYNEQFNKTDSNKAKDEKLHPSWEAKKKLSSILPFQGKKIVFNES